MGAVKGVAMLYSLRPSHAHQVAPCPCGALSGPCPHLEGGGYPPREAGDWGPLVGPIILCEQNEEYFHTKFTELKQLAMV